MIIYQRPEVPVNVSIVSISNSPYHIIAKYFPKEEKYFVKDEFFQGAWDIRIMNSLISNELFKEFLMQLPEAMGSFDITVENQTHYIYEAFAYMQGSDYISRKYLTEDYINENKPMNLINILFNLQEQKIELKKEKVN